MNTQHLITFCTVLSEGNMTAAADKLFLTQPAVSQQIRSLEEQVGAKLLIRSARQVRPTAQGQLLRDYAKKILFLSQQASVAIQSMSEEVSGSLCVGTVNSIGLHLISPLIGLFLKHNPNLNLKLTYGSYDEILEKMKTQEVDVAILADVEKESGEAIPGYQGKFLMSDEMWLVASGRDASVPATTDVKDFTKYPIVVLSDMYRSFEKQLGEKLSAQGINFVSVFESDNLGTVKRVVESGVGWGFMPSHAIRKQVRLNRLSHVQVNDLKFSINVNFYSRNNRDIQKPSEVLMRALSQHILAVL